MSIDIEELKRLRDADAPTGTWGACPMQYDHGHEGGDDDWVVYLERTEERGHGGLVCADLRKESAQYIAALNNVVPVLIERLEAAERDGGGRWQQGWNECSALRETQIAEAERDAAKYRALLVSAKGKPESLERLLPGGSHDHYISQSVIDDFEADPNVQMAAHILVSERPGKFDLIHLVAYLMSSHWMPIDSAPKGHSLLLWTDHGPALGWWSVFDNQWTAGLWTALFPTHYMLIPPMPESKP